MAKRKRKRARKKNPTRKRVSHKRRHKRKAAANPRRRRARRTAKRRVRRASAANPRRRRRRARVSNPRRRRTRKHVVRAHMSNPRRRHRRRSRRNPGIPSWALLLLAGAAGVGAFAISQASTFALTQRLDPTLNTMMRNRIIGAGLLGVAGVLVGVYASPVIGAGIVGGSVAAAFGTQAAFAIGTVIDVPAAAPAAPAPTTKGLFPAGGGMQQFAGLLNAGSGNQSFAGMRGIISSGNGDQYF